MSISKNNKTKQIPNRMSIDPKSPPLRRKRSFVESMNNMNPFNIPEEDLEILNSIISNNHRNETVSSNELMNLVRQFNESINN